jgi:hypothetical protein
MTNREGLSQRGRVGIEPHLESRPLERDRERPGGQGKRFSVSDRADLSFFATTVSPKKKRLASSQCGDTAPAPSRERERRTPEGEEKSPPKGLRKDKERKREDKEREEVKEGERTTERDRERPGGQGKRDSVSDGADLRLLREWGREQDRARVST